MPAVGLQAAGIPSSARYAAWHTETWERDGTVFLIVFVDYVDEVRRVRSPDVRVEVMDDGGETVDFTPSLDGARSAAA